MSQNHNNNANYNKRLYKQSIQIQMRVLVIALLLCAAACNTLTRSTCTNAQIFDTTTLGCVNCPQGMRPNPLQQIPTTCVCNLGSIPTGINTCKNLNSTDPKCASNQYYKAVEDNGAYNAAISTSQFACEKCDAKAYADSNGTSCIPCPRNMKYSVSSKICECQSGSYTYTALGCFTGAETSSTSHLLQASSNYNSQLKYLLPACSHFSDLLSCSHLINLCIYSIGLGSTSNPQCNFFSSSSFTSYLQPDTTKSYYRDPGSFYKNEQLKFKLLIYLPTGNLVNQKQMKLPDIFRCGVPYNNSASILLGNNIEVTCSFDFDYITEKISTNTYRNYLYELFLMGANNEYYPVTIYIGKSTTPLKRFFLQDTYTSQSSINVMTYMKFTLTLNSTGYLVSPTLSVSYTQLSVQSGTVTPTSASTQQITYIVKFAYSLSSFWPAFIGIFIAVNIIVLIQSIVRTYIAHLNRQSLFGFFYYFPKFWSLWMFYFLIAMSGYWFLFSKSTQGVFIFIPDSDSSFFYAAFYIIAGIMGFFRIITVLYDKKDKLNYEVFMINWQKGKNSWREIFIVNSLAQFYTHRTISFFWMLLCLMFFLVGLGWQSHASEVMHTNISQIYYFNPWNRVFLYFMGASILLVIGIIFKILRRISVIQWPYPFQNLVDYCTVTNISLFFMKKRTSEAFYIHASIPDRTEVTYKQINDAIRRGLNKNRNILNEHSFHEGQRMYSLYVCKDLQDKFHNMVKKSEDEKQEKINKNVNSKEEKKRLKNYVNPRDQFIEKRLKPYVDAIMREGSQRTKSLFNRLFGLPQIDLRDQNLLKNSNYVIFDDNLDIMSQVFPNGNEFQQIHTFIIIFLMFLLLTLNVCAAALIAYFIDYYLIDKWIANSCRQNLEHMTKVKQGFML